MSKELNCLNCCIGDFKNSLCDCNSGMCKEYKKVGSAEDFENEVLNRTKRKKGHWIVKDVYSNWTDWTLYYCSECGCQFKNLEALRFCPSCGADMRGDECDD